MVTHVDEISTPPTPADAPEVFEQRASQVWSDLARAVPQMNEQAQQNNAAAQAADAAKVRAIAEADAAMGYRNEAVAARDSANAAKQAAELAQDGAEQAKGDAEAARDAAQASAAAWAYSMPALVKTDPTAPCLIKTSATALAIKAGTHVKIGNAYVSFTAQTAVTMPAVLTPGEDYAVFVHPDGTASAVADPFFAPAAAPVLGAVKVGGFHNGLESPGMTVASGGFATSGPGMIWTQTDVDDLAGINKYSIWDLHFRSAGEQHGFAFDPYIKAWGAIYFCSTDHITQGISRYNTNVASGTVRPKIPLAYGGNGTNTYGRLSAYEAIEILASHGCRLIEYGEFCSFAYGVTEGQSLGGAETTIPATGRAAGYVSRTGLQQASGHMWTIGGPLTSLGGSPWAADPGRGSLYGTSGGLPLFGGSRNSAAYSGSRASFWYFDLWDDDWGIGLRAACDHYQGGF